MKAHEKDLIVLGIETSGPPTSLAITDGKELLYEVFVGMKFTHSEQLNPLLDEAMDTLKLSFHDLGLVAVSIGPGYFTALRAGLSVGKALCLSLGIPLVGVPTLRALREEISIRGKGQKVIPVVDAQKKMVYAEISIWDGKNWDLEVGPSIYNPSELMEKHKDAIFIGGGAQIYPELSPTPIPNPFVPRAFTVARMGLEMYLKGKSSDPESLEPLYIKYADITKKGQSNKVQR